MFAASRRVAGFCRAAIAGVALALLPATGALALVVSETDTGEFSSDWTSPSVIGAGATGVSGTGSANSYDIFRFTGLAAGAQTLTMTFVAPEGIGYSYSAGATVVWSDEAFRWGWDGDVVDTVQIDYYKTAQTVTLNLPASFAGDLWLGLYFTHGASLAYTIMADVTGSKPGAGDPPVKVPGGIDSESGAVAPAAVPLPPALGMLGAALAGLGVVARRRRAAA